MGRILYYRSTCEQWTKLVRTKQPYDSKAVIGLQLIIRWTDRHGVVKTIYATSKDSFDEAAGISSEENGTVPFLT